MIFHAKYSPTMRRWISCGADDAAIMINHVAPMLPGTICNPRAVLARRTAAMRMVNAHQWRIQGG
jgi:hypothetical protein